MRNPKVTVVVQTYNHAPFIALALNGVLMQETDFAYDVRVVDDCSTDGTLDILRRYQREYPDKIRLVLSDRNQNNLNNIVETLENAKGQYIAWMDGDDCWTSAKKLQTQADLLDRHSECSIVFHNVVIFDEGGHKASRLFNEPGTQKQISNIDDLFARNFIGGCSPMWRAAAMPQFTDWYRCNRYGDWPLYISCAQKGNITFIDEVMGVYRLHAGGIFGSLTVAEQASQMIDYLKELDRHFDFAYSAPIKNSIEKLERHLEHVTESGAGKQLCYTPATAASPLRSAYWPLALMLGRGEDARPLLDNLCVPNDAVDEFELARVLFEGAPLSQANPSAYWKNPSADTTKRLRDLLFAIELRTERRDLTERTLSKLDSMSEKRKAPVAAVL